MQETRVEYESWCFVFNHIERNSMFILGLDMSTQKTGYAVFEVNGEDKCLCDYGCFEMLSTQEKDWRTRIKYMANQLGELMGQYEFSKVYIEDVPPIVNNSQTVKILGALQGIVLGVTGVFGVKTEFILVETWKNKLNINLTHSKEYNKAKKDLKGDKKGLESLKGKTKAYEKKMSIDLVNSEFGIDLVWKSFGSKQNDDDIADAINIVSSVIYDKYKYNLRDFEDIMNELKPL